MCECVKCSYLGNKWASLPGERAAQQAWGWPALLFLCIDAFLIFFLTPRTAIILKINLAQIKIVPLGSGKWLPCFYWEDKVFISSLVGFLWGGFLSLSNCPIKCNLGMSANPVECTVQVRLLPGRALMNPTETSKKKNSTSDHVCLPWFCFLKFRPYNRDL